MAETPELLNFKGWMARKEVDVDRLRALVRTGKLPPDILLRVIHIGAFEPAPNSTPETFQSLYWATITDAIDTADDPSSAQPITQQLVFHSQLPNTIIDLEGYFNDQLYNQLASPYWSRKALTKTILQRRAADGSALTDPSNENYWTYWTEQQEKNRCRGLAQVVWRALVQRLHPDIIKHPRWFYPNVHISFSGVRDLSERTIRRNAIACTRIEDGALRTLYDEIRTTGVKGIGPVGERDIAAMLAPEHPDIMLQLATEAGLEVEQDYSS